MKFQNCLLKRNFGHIFLFHTLSSYHVELDEQTLAVLQGMVYKDKDSLSEQEKIYYQKLAAKGIVTDGQGGIPERSQSHLEYITLEVTDACNLKCKHCFTKKGENFLTRDIFEKILKGALELGAITISFNGGEPLLNPYLLDMMVQTRAAEFRIDLFTNGTLVTDGFCEKASGLSPARVYVSLDGFQKSHEDIRGEGTFQKTVDGVKLLCRHGLKVFVNSMVHSGNENEVEKFQEYCLGDLKVTGVRFCPVNLIGNAQKHPDLFKPPKMEPNKYASLPEMTDAQSVTQDLFINCKGGITKIFVSARGMIYPCHYFKDCMFLLGDLNTRDLSEIYSTNLATESLLTKFDLSVLPECSSCPALNKCRGGCRARALLMSGNLLGKDTVSCSMHLGSQS